MLQETSVSRRKISASDYEVSEDRIIELFLWNATEYRRLPASIIAKLKILRIPASSNRNEKVYKFHFTSYFLLVLLKVVKDINLQLARCSDLFLRCWLPSLKLL